MTTKKTTNKVTTLKTKAKSDESCCKEVDTAIPYAEKIASNAPSSVIGISPEAIRTFSLLSSSIIFASPAFATQANPTNIISLADMFYRYALGNIAVQQPSDQVGSDAVKPEAQTFG